DVELVVRPVELDGDPGRVDLDRAQVVRRARRHARATGGHRDGPGRCRDGAVVVDGDDVEGVRDAGGQAGGGVGAAVPRGGQFTVAVHPPVGRLGEVAGGPLEGDRGGGDVGDEDVQRGRGSPGGGRGGRREDGEDQSGRQRGGREPGQPAGRAPWRR